MIIKVGNGFEERLIGRMLTHLLIEVQTQLCPMSNKVKAMDDFHVVQQITCHWIGSWAIQADLYIQLFTQEFVFASL